MATILGSIILIDKEGKFIFSSWPMVRGKALEFGFVIGRIVTAGYRLHAIDGMLIY